jgi:hypothetical protein
MKSIIGLPNVSLSFGEEGGEEELGSSEAFCDIVRRVSRLDVDCGRYVKKPGEWLSSDTPKIGK